MRGASLFIVFVLARTLGLWGQPIPHSAWTPLAFLWQDAAVAAAFGVVFERLIRRDSVSRVAYGILVLLAAVNVPVLQVLSTPITTPMLRATGSALADSIRYYVTPANVARVLTVIVVGVSLPGAIRRAAAWWKHASLRRSLGMRLATGSAAVVLVGGPVSAAHLETRGLERNPVIALVQSAFPRIRGTPSNADFRASVVSGVSVEELASLHGAAAGRDVLLVVLESTAARYLASYGAADDPMPHLTALASRAIVFDHAYAVYPESVKGLVSLLASRYAAFDVAAERHAPLMATTIAHALGARGYETALFHSGRFMYLGMEELVRAAGFARLEDAGDIGGNHESSFGIDERATVDRMLQWIDSVPRGRHFFAVYLPIAGHHPYANTGEGPFTNAREIDRYKNALFDADDALGRLLSGLRARAREDSTLVVVVGDHGEAFGQHAGNYAHTLALFDENVRVPFLFTAPGSTIPPRRLSRVVSVVDVSPTILALLGVESPPEFQGSAGFDGPARTALFFTDYSRGLLGLRDGCWKFLYEVGSRDAELYDVCRDPEEQIDLSPRESSLAAAYRRRLEAWSAAQVDAVRRAGPRATR